VTEHWNVTVDHAVCVRTGLCAASAPEFTLDANGQGQPSAETLPSSETIWYAAESCPVEAIAITRAGSGEAVFPPPD
jgi:ferredoxin